MGTIISAIVDGILKSAFGWLSSIMEKRQLLQQGREQQHSDDLSASVKEAKDAAQIRETVQTSDISAIDTDLERLRHSPTAGH